MAQKYTILKAITRTSNKGFTLLELLIGMIITLIIGGLAMQAFINASATFSKDKKTIDSNQNMSAVLEIIGNDIRQAGENISESTFPVIEFNIANASETTLMSGSSKIIIRRALSDPLTLCQSIPITPLPTSLTTLTVADNTLTGDNSKNCNVGTTTSQLLGSRPSKSYTLPISTAAPVPVTFATLFPNALRKARDYRCQIDEPNPTTPYDSDSAANVIADFCGSPNAALEKVRVAIADKSGHILIFNETGEAALSGNTTDDYIPTSTNPIIKKYGITVNTVGLDASTAANNTKNEAVPYDIGSPIYLIEERVYTLDKDGNLQVSIDGGKASTLIKRIGKFNVSARRYTNTTDRVINPTPAAFAAPATRGDVLSADICTERPTSPTIQNPEYICKFNYNTAVGDAAMSWKLIAGIRINLQAKYDGTGGVSETSTAPADVAAVAAAKEKLSATAEFFPRNVLSK
jgi:prepilin-type N-terminal cleavage/methylation domain-containing protein